MTRATPAHPGVHGDRRACTPRSPRRRRACSPRRWTTRWRSPERPNMPATTHQWPNWSIALPEPIETLKNEPPRGVDRARADAGGDPAPADVRSGAALRHPLPTCRYRRHSRPARPGRPRRARRAARPIITSVALMTASASSPRRSFSSSTRVAGDDRCQGLVADAEPDLGEQPLGADLLDDAAQLVAAAERDDLRALRVAGAGGRARPVAASRRSISLSGIRWCPPAVRRVRIDPCRSSV